MSSGDSRHKNGRKLVVEVTIDDVGLETRSWKPTHCGRTDFAGDTTLSSLVSIVRPKSALLESVSRVFVDG